MAEHAYRFYRIGGVDQVALDGDADLAHLPELDVKLWAALAMPTRGIDLDPRTLDLVDTDKDGRIRTPEVLAAVAWARAQLERPEDLFQGGDSLALTSIKDGPVRAGARRILENLRKGEATAVTLADVADTAKIFAATRFNGDGVITPESAGEDLALRKVVEEIAATQGSVPDRSGKPGVDKAKIEAFFSQAKAWCAWRDRAAADAQLLPAGEKTDAAAAAFLAVEPKIEEYFTRCQLHAFDTRTAVVLEQRDLDAAKAPLAITADDLARLPIARAETARALPLAEGINPAWRGPLAAFVQQAALPLLGKEVVGLSEQEWAGLKAKLAPWRAWQASKPVTAVEKLGAERLRAVCEPEVEKGVLDLLAKDLAVEGDSAQIESVEKLLRLKRDLVRLLNNFVNFSEFFGRKGAAFQVGTLFMDGRACDLCVEVVDAGKHAALAGMSASYLAYCDCVRPGGEKKSVVAAFTDGDSDNLFVGRNGIFVDRKGRDWDATVTKIVSNPISIREAFWTPYKKFVRFIEDQVGKRAAASDAEVTGKLQGAAAATANADKTKLPEAKKIDIGTVAALGVAVGGIGAMVTGIFGALMGLGWWMPFGILGAVLAISGPSMILAWLKLRQRNLGPILDANGWAVNGRAKINVPFGAALTRIAALPKNATRSLRDPLAEKRKPWGLYLVIAAVLGLGAAWYLGKLDDYLPKSAKSVHVLGDNAPAAPAAEAQPGK